MSGAVKCTSAYDIIAYDPDILFSIHNVMEFATFLFPTASFKAVMKTLKYQAFVSSQKFKNLEIPP